MSTTLYSPAETAQKFADIIDFREQAGLVGRRTELHVMTVAIVRRLHVILHGKPGVAKSMTTDGLLKHIPHMSKFKTQAYKASPPEQFIGPISLKAMAEQDRYLRITTGKAAASEIVVIDELPRAPRALLPVFQGMMVEREFDSGNGVESVPLNTLIGTSNHLLDDPELEAFFDRFALKLVVKSPQSQSQFVEIMRGALHRAAHGEPAIPDELIVQQREMSEFQDFAEQVHVPDAILEMFGELWANLLGAGVEPSIRRYVDTVYAMQATAALRGSDEVDQDDLQMAQHALWTSEDEIPTVYAEVVKFASAWVQKRSELLDSFAETLDRLNQVQSLVASGADTAQHATIDDKDLSITDHAIKVVNAQGKLRKLVEDHIADATGQDTSELEAMLTQMDAAKSWVQERILGGLAL
jgi:MoxR-like ATPase